MFFLSIFTNFAQQRTKKATIVTKIIISLGSNTFPEQHIEQAICLLRQAFGELMVTRQLWTEPIGMESSARSMQQVQEELKRIEVLCGRKPEDKAKGTVVVDADLLLYNDTRCHLNDWQRDYVKILMAELDASYADFSASNVCQSCGLGLSFVKMSSTTSPFSNDFLTLMMR